MNTGFRPIPRDMPLDRAADLMVRRGEARTWHQAKARLLRQRSGAKYGRTTPALNDPALAVVESPRLRLPYRDD
jgi:hypothetical protein